MPSMQLQIENMHCGNCVRHVREKLERIQGVQVRSVEIGSAELDIEPQVAPSQVTQALTEAGYPARQRS